ncbi:hypothetical protein C9I98_17270 [Photobacterium sanctipauli]|uniref:Zinc ribbon domain-containing protein n=1 Tax=Photobacterium sanctipauli TaxID=1342794 RepID=A0A2T3NPR8_9GAMM|nr:hypothetical protein C9I98_17270 [Photobacterium sanctipauli]
MFFWFCFYLVFFCISVAIGYQKGNLIAGVLLGYVLGPVGALLMYMSKDRKHIECPECHQSIHKNSYYCPKCQHKVRLKTAQ